MKDNLVNELPIGVAIQENGRLTYVNEAFTALTRGLNPQSLDSMLQPLDEEYTISIQHQDEQSFLRVRVQGDDERRIYTVDNITEQKAREEALRMEALTDHKTGIWNSTAYSADIEREVNRVNRYNGPLTLITLDFDDFKSMNTKHGHPGGDKLLRWFAQGLQNSLHRDSDRAYRTGGDEFAIITPSIVPASFPNRIAEYLRNNPCPDPMQSITASIGVAEHLTGNSVADLEAMADQAMYLAKDKGKDRVEFYRT